MITLRPNKQRAKTIINLIWIVQFVELVSLLSNYLQYKLITDVINGEQITEEAANANDTRVYIISVIYILFVLITGIYFIRWFRRAYYNLHQISDHLTSTDGWAAAAWFVPIISLFRPYQIMRELFVETGEYLKKRNKNYTELPFENIVGVWWFFYLAHNIIGQIVFRFSDNLSSLDSIQNITILSIVNNFVGIISALVVIKVIQKYSLIEDKLAEQVITENNLIEESVEE